MRLPALVAAMLTLAPSALGQAETPADPAALAERERLGVALEAMARDHPDLVALSVVGMSVRGEPLWRVDVADFADPAWESHPALLVDGGHHGNEFSGVYAAWFFLAALVDEAAADPAVLDGKRVVVIPSVNPDGWVLNLRSNANGVNLNRNYPYRWSERGVDPVPQPLGNYPGSAAGSEPETRAVMETMEQLDLRAYISFHCCGPEPGGELVLPWGPENDGPIPDWGVYQEFLSAAKAAGVLEYRAPNALGESISHAYGNLGAIAFIPETPGAANPPQEDATRAAELAEMLAVPRLALRHLADLGARLEIAPGTGGALVLRNAGWAPAYNLTGAVTLARLDPGAEVAWPGGACALEYDRLLQPASPGRIVVGCPAPPAAAVPLPAWWIGILLVGLLVRRR